MQIRETNLRGVMVFEPQRAQDERGYFARTFCEKLFQEHRLETRFVQWAAAFNHLKGTTRGLHFQRSPHAEVKLVRCTSGAARDVVVDIRPDSSTYLKVFMTTLTQDNGLSLYIGKGFAHGYQTLEERTELAYAMSTEYILEAATGLRWDDPALAIAWPLPVSLISDRDRAWPLVGSRESGLPLNGASTR